MRMRSSSSQPSLQAVICSCQPSEIYHAITATLVDARITPTYKHRFPLPLGCRVTVGSGGSQQSIRHGLRQMFRPNCPEL